DDPRVTETYVQSQGNTMQFVGVPFVPFPNFSGKIENPPLRELEVGTRRNDGLRILSTWNPFTLLGQKQPDGVDARLHADAFTERGGGGGIDFRYDVGDAYGRIDLYGLHDTGVDRTSSGLDVDPEQEFRGVGLIEHTSKLSEYWTLQAQ